MRDDEDTTIEPDNSEVAEHCENCGRETIGEQCTICGTPLCAGCFEGGCGVCVGCHKECGVPDHD